MSTSRTLWLLSLALGSSLAFGQLPDAPHKDTAVKLCGTCHSANIVMGRAMSREQWGEVVSNMIAKGAKGTPAEFNQVVDYLAAALPAKPAADSARRRGGFGGFQVGPNDKQIVDAEAANRGKAIYFQDCITCHGPKARGPKTTEAGKDTRGLDLVRSLVVLHDRYGTKVGPFMQKGHPTQSGIASSSYTDAQIQDLSHFLHQRLEDTLRSGPYNKVLDVLTGDAKAGAAYFNGEGKCSTCHSPTGDLAHIASKYDPPALQQKFLFPRTLRFGPGAPSSPPKPVMVTVKQPGAASVTGELIRIDDFNVALRDSDGEYKSFTRSPNVQVTKSDPYETHEALLDKYTDKNMHDIVAYLETLK